jgi:hypothetical protein
MRPMAWCLAAVAGVILTAGVVEAGGKPAQAAGKPAPAPPPYSPWTCNVTLRTAEGDMVRSDGKGAYVNGVGGVHCGIQSDPSATKYGWLGLGFDSTSARYILYPGQLQDVDGGPGYATMNSRGSFEVKGLAAKVVWNWNPDYFDVLPFRANQMNSNTEKLFANRMGQFFGDSNFTSGDTSGSSSVFVQPLAEPSGSPASCSWSVWLDPLAERVYSSLGELPQTRAGMNPYPGPSIPPYGPRVLEIREGVGYSQVRGLYVMPFQATVRITGGGPAAGNPYPYAGCK